MRSRMVGAALAATLVIGSTVVLVPVAYGDIANGNSTTVQEGDNGNETDQDGGAHSGDVVAGQVAGAVVSGDLSLDATNLSSDVDAESGDAAGSNTSRSLTGTHVSGRGCPAGADRTSAKACPRQAAASDISNLIAVLLHLGDNSVSLDQFAEVRSGDAVAGQVIGGVVTGTADLVLANTSHGVDATSGDGDMTNLAEAFVGSTSVIFGRICDGVPCPLPQDLGAAVASDPSARSGEVGPLARFRLEQAGVGDLGTSGVVMVGLFLVAAVCVARRRRIAAPALASSGMHPGSAREDGPPRPSGADVPVRAASADRTVTGGSSKPVSTADVVTASLIVLGGFLVARRLGRKSGAEAKK